MTNPLTNTPGILQFAGSYGGSGVSCGCATPVAYLLEELGSARRSCLLHQRQNRRPRRIRAGLLRGRRRRRPREEMQAIKWSPREETANRYLLRRADGSTRSFRSKNRTELGRLLDGFEAALEMGEKEVNCPLFRDRQGVPRYARGPGG